MIASSKMQRLTSSRPGSGALLRAAPRLAAPVHGRSERKVARAGQGQQTQKDRDNRSDQLNPNNDKSQGGTTKYTGTGDKSDLDNRSNQMNPNNPNYQEPARKK